MGGSYISLNRGRRSQHLLIIRMLESVYSTANRVGERKKNEACICVQQSRAQGM